jgi:hypothetical protein
LEGFWKFLTVLDCGAQDGGLALLRAFALRRANPPYGALEFRRRAIRLVIGLPFAAGQHPHHKSPVLSSAGGTRRAIETYVAWHNTF